MSEIISGPTRPRSATERDLADIVYLTMEMREEALNWFPDVDEAYYIRSLSLMMSLPNEYLVLVVGSPVHGMLVALAGSQLYSPRRMASCQLLYVSPVYRSLSVVRSLVRAYEQWVEDIDALPAHVGVNTGLDISPLLRRLGYFQLGTSWRRSYV